MTVSNENGADDDIGFKADLTLERLQPNLQKVWCETGISDSKRSEFEYRLKRTGDRSFEICFSSISPALTSTTTLIKS